MKISGKIMLALGAATMVASAPVPSFAADMAKQSGASSAEQSANWHRRGWGHRNRVDGGDILTGIGILAGIAIIADAASKSDKRDRDEPRYEERRDDRPVYQDDDLGGAVTACTDAAERSVNDGTRVSEIRSVTRDGNGWRVEGNIADDGFTCATANGRVDYIRIDNRDI